MKAKLIINNNEIEVEISEAELKKFEVKPVKNTGYERLDDNQVFWYDAGGATGSDYDMHGDGEIQQMYEVANYYSNFDVAYNNARADKLMRQLRRFAVEHRENTINYDEGVYEILYSYCDKKLKVEDICDCKYFGDIEFDTYETAQLAIDTFYDELIWYFTEYKDSL